MARKRKPIPTQHDKRRQRAQREAQQQKAVVEDTAARFTCAAETADDFAYHCTHAMEQLDLDLPGPPPCARDLARASRSCSGSARSTRGVVDRTVATPRDARTRRPASTNPRRRSRLPYPSRTGRALSGSGAKPVVPAAANQVLLIDDALVHSAATAPFGHRGQWYTSPRLLVHPLTAANTRAHRLPPCRRSGLEPLSWTVFVQTGKEVSKW